MIDIDNVTPDHEGRSVAGLFRAGERRTLAARCSHQTKRQSAYLADSGGQGRTPSMSTAQPEPRQRRLFSPTAGLRRSRGWSQSRLAREFQVLGERLGLPVPAALPTVIKQISRIERGATVLPDDMYLRLWCAAFDAAPAELFGQLGGAPAADVLVESHKFIPALVGPGQIARLTSGGGYADAQHGWTQCRYRSLATTGARLYLWPFGVAVVHLREQLRMGSIAELAAWRRSTYATSRNWAESVLREVTGDPRIISPYVFSLYWLHRAAWRAERLDSAVRLLAMPSVLLDRAGCAADEATLRTRAEALERVLLRDGDVHRPDLTSFGVRGVSVGYASWSGVAYHPVAAQQALTIGELVACQLSVQAIWCYTHEILRQVEEGRDPAVPAEYGWRYLRGLRWRVGVPRPREDGQHHSLRDAVLDTSGLTRQLDAVVEVLRETERGPSR
ncbi:hypothetical protein GCM10010124_39790 [Pilimelia terevasa]|uniref:Uncharacterized protein n=1 Tax=Pilimelia terevasa TaxID=53372 RepID=A0A8J3BS48_9ACTN|nr:helix-turn-helix domain-containing protein [Pilimelia terevasa]GGK43010.1 hypothetical protein GCM10010124_39790 [Pilimelia terevasa]